MRRITCWLGHKWTFPTPQRVGGALSLWRGCMRCGDQQVQSAYGKWKEWHGHQQD